MPKMVTAFDGAEALQQCVWKYHDLPSQYKGYLKSALDGVALWSTARDERGARPRRYRPCSARTDAAARRSCRRGGRRRQG